MSHHVIFNLYRKSNVGGECAESLKPRPKCQIHYKETGSSGVKGRLAPMVRLNSINIRKQILEGSKVGSGHGLFLVVFEPDFDKTDIFVGRGRE